MTFNKMTEAQLLEAGKKALMAQERIKMADELRAKRRSWKQEQIEHFYEEKSGKTLDELEADSKVKFPKTF